MDFYLHLSHKTVVLLESETSANNRQGYFTHNKRGDRSLAQESNHYPIATTLSSLCSPKFMIIEAQTIEL